MASALISSAVVSCLSSRCALFCHLASRSFCNSVSPSSRIFYKPLRSSSSPICVSLNNDNAAASLPHDAQTNDVSALKAAAEALDIRVGRILKVWRHTEADSLFVEEVDVGEPEPRTICSGLVKYVSQDELQGSNVVVLANLKPRNLRGVKSSGMLMAASDASHENVELLAPPEGSIPGERIWFGSDDEINNQSDPASPSQVQKKKLWETVQPHLRTTDDCVAVLGERPMRTPAGLVTCRSRRKRLWEIVRPHLRTTNDCSCIWRKADVNAGRLGSLKKECQHFLIKLCIQQLFLYNVDCCAFMLH